MLPTWINSYVGLPFLDGGRTREGVDCWGLVRLIYDQERCLYLRDYSHDYDSVLSEKVEELVRQEKGRWMNVQNPQEFDVVAFNVFGRPTHVGIVVGTGQFLHSPEGDFTRVERFTDRVWKRRVEGFYRYV